MKKKHKNRKHRIMYVAYHNEQEERFNRIFREAENQLNDLIGNKDPLNPRNSGDKGVILPSFSTDLKGYLPDILEEAISLGRDEKQADVILLAALVAFSSCMTNCIFRYGDRFYYPNLFVIITGSAASGKSLAGISRYLVKPINDEMQQQAEIDAKEYKARIENGVKAEQLQKPRKRTLFIPADSSSAAFTRTLIDNDGCGLMETAEIDNMNRVNGTDYGDYSALLRQGYENETMEINRMTDITIQQIQTPRFAMILAGTPNQVRTLIPTIENGLFSRVMFYILPSTYEYYVNLDEDEDGYERKTNEEEFTRLGAIFYSCWQKVKNKERIRIKVDKECRRKMQIMMQVLQDICVTWKGDAPISVTHRLGSYVMKIASVLTYLRHMGDPVIQDFYWCDECDFVNALVIVKVVLLHSMRLCGNVVAEPQVKVAVVKGLDNREDVQKLFAALPEAFDKQEFIRISRAQGKYPKTTEKWLPDWVGQGKITIESRGHYRKNK